MRSWPRTPSPSAELQVDAIGRRAQSVQLEQQERFVTTTQSTTHTLNVPGATLAYDIRRNNTTTEPVLLLIGVTDGRRGIRHARQPFHRPHRRHLRPRGCERSDTGTWSSSQGRPRAAWMCPSHPNAP